MNLRHIAHRFGDIDGVRVFCRDTELVDALSMLLLLGLASSSSVSLPAVDNSDGRDSSD